MNEQPIDKLAGVPYETHTQRAGFSARSFQHSEFCGLMNPLIMVDPFVMTEPTFGTHPHAGVVVADGASLMIEILGDNASPEAGEVYGSLAMDWSILVGQVRSSAT